jgi:hypothetical protein
MGPWVMDVAPLSWKLTCVRLMPNQVSASQTIAAHLHRAMGKPHAVVPGKGGASKGANTRIWLEVEHGHAIDWQICGLGLVTTGMP